ncbi:hypothetical protein JXB28_06615 [Candidatus Woesearchaeota archaeon]|nr:hypothetical protein [Candidatus Woesearchaeota archaeon]
MLNSKSQLSIEYMILTGFVLLIIIVPSVVFLYSMTNKGVYGSINAQKANELGNGLVNNAQQVYYLGIYSKKIVAYDVPENVEKIFIMDMSMGSKNYSYVGIIINDRKEVLRMFFPSNVPLIADHPDLVDPDDADGSTKAYVPECNEPDAKCKFYNFKGYVLKPGKKEFKIETKYVPLTSEAKVFINPVDNT